ncbi:uncharacterized protein [Clytia hemisphaerica]|uniref:uncharacterized protein n=1 Tax=Clytia hemisphaerica TaxID=252671 RepID=UPI0034D43663
MTASENEDVLTASEVSDNSADEATDTTSEHSDEVLDSDIDNLEEYLSAKREASDVEMDDTDAIDFTILPEAIVVLDQPEGQDESCHQTTFAAIDICACMALE